MQKFDDTEAERLCQNGEINTEIKKLSEHNTKPIQDCATNFSVSMDPSSAEATNREHSDAQESAESKSSVELKKPRSRYFIQLQKSKVKQAFASMQITTPSSGGQTKPNRLTWLKPKPIAKTESLEQRIRVLENGRPPLISPGNDPNINDTQRVKDLQQKIMELEVQKESMHNELRKGQEKLDKLSQDYHEMMEQSRIQCKAMVGLKNERDSLELSMNELETAKAEKEQKMRADRKSEQEHGSQVPRTYFRSLSSSKKPEANPISRVQQENPEVKSVVSNLIKEVERLKPIEEQYHIFQQASVTQRAFIQQQDKKLQNLTCEVANLTGNLDECRRELKCVTEERDELFSDLKSYVQMNEEKESKQYIEILQQENLDLQKKLKEVKEQLEINKFQAYQYKQDFEEERAAREEAIGAKDALNETLDSTMAEVVVLQKEKKCVIGKLEEAFESKHGLEQTLAAKTLEVKHLSLESSVFKQQLQKEKNMYEHRENELTQKIEQKVADVAILHGKFVTMTNKIKHQNESFQAKLDQANAVLEQTQRELIRYREEATQLKLQKYTVVQLLDKRLKELTPLMPSSPATPKEPRYNEDIKNLVIKLKTSIRYNDQNRIGTGGYGSVYAVELNGSPCIAKRLHDILMGRGKQEDVHTLEKQACHEKFCRECVLMSQAKHKNIVKFLGVHFGKNQFDLTLFMERLHTDLYAYLDHTPNIPLPTKVSILHDVSCGLLYLHEECSIIHRDLTAANILLTVDNRAKIADLGVSRFYRTTFSQLSKQPGTLPYMSPEALKDEPNYNESLDIFSFGVLTLSVGITKSPELSWDRVPDAVHTAGKGEIFKRQNWIAMLEREQCEFSPLVLWCLCDDPVSRPTTYCVNVILQEIKRTL